MKVISRMVNQDGGPNTSTTLNIAWVDSLVASPLAYQSFCTGSTPTRTKLFHSGQVRFRRFRFRFQVAGEPQGYRDTQVPGASSDPTPLSDPQVPGTPTQRHPGPTTRFHGHPDIPRLRDTHRPPARRLRLKIKHPNSLGLPFNTQA